MRMVWTGVRPYILRYCAANRPRWVKPHRIATSLTVPTV